MTHSMKYETHWEFLKSCAMLGKLSHAYLFSGNDEAGQQSLALKLAQLLNCESKKEEKPCGMCISCKGIQKKTHPDLLWIAEQGEIPISVIRNLRNHFALSSWQSPFKIAVIEKAHRMNAEAQSALLKLLEEPKGNTLFFLLTAHPGMLLDTIHSRAQEMRWYTFNAMLEDGEAKKSREELERLKGSLLQERFDYAKKAGETAEEVARVLDVWLWQERSLLLGALSGVSPSVAQEENTVKVMQEMLHIVNTTNVTPRLALEQVLLEL